MLFLGFVSYLESPFLPLRYKKKKNSANHQVQNKTWETFSFRGQIAAWLTMGVWSLYKCECKAT